jgi:hypothetical protein
MSRGTCQLRVLGLDTLGNSNRHSTAPTVATTTPTTTATHTRTCTCTCTCTRTTPTAAAASAATAYAAAVDLVNRGELAHGTCGEHLVGGVELGQRQPPLLQGQPQSTYNVHHRGPRDTYGCVRGCVSGCIVASISERMTME